MPYPQTNPLPRILGPTNSLIREDFTLIGIGLRMGQALRAAGESDPRFLKDLKTLESKAQKFIERYDLNPIDYAPDQVAYYSRKKTWR